MRTTVHGYPECVELEFEQRFALIEAGHDPDDPAVVDAVTLVRLELGLLGLSRH